MVRKTTSGNTAASKTTTGKTATSKTAAKTAAKSVARKNPRSSASAAVAVKKSSEIKPRKALATTAQKLRSPKILVPLTVAVGLGVAAVRKIMMSSAGKNAAALPRLAKEISPRFSEAVKALAELGRELRSKIR